MKFHRIKKEALSKDMSINDLMNYDIATSDNFVD